MHANRNDPTRDPWARRAAAALGAVVLVALGVFAGATLTSDDAGPAATPVPAPTPSSSPEPSPTSKPEPTRVRVPTAAHELWFVQGETLSWGATVIGGRIERDRAADDPISQKAAFWFDILLIGAQGAFQEAGDETAIPEGTELLYVERDGSVLNVDLSSEFESGGGSLSMQLRVAQIVYTGTQFEGIDAVRILLDGKRVDAIGGEGIVASEPLTRRDFQNVAPPIVPESPKPGAEISGSVVVSGFANVFEANVVIQIRDLSGKILAETFTTATCGSGCWGDFSEEVAFEIDAPQEGSVSVLTYSAEDGSERDRISIPVMLLP